jgi:hypothetical protein
LETALKISTFSFKYKLSATDQHGLLKMPKNYGMYDLFDGLLVDAMVVLSDYASFVL